MESVIGLIGSALFGAGTGGLGVILGGIGKAFTWWAEAKEKQAEHERVLELTRLNAEIRMNEAEFEREVRLDEIAGRLREASYSHDTGTGKASKWVINILRLVRPALTLALVGLLAYVYMTIADQLTQQEIVNSVIFMATSAVTWWFGDRMTARKK